MSILKKKSSFKEFQDYVSELETECGSFCKTTEEKYLLLEEEVEELFKTFFKPNNIKE